MYSLFLFANLWNDANMLDQVSSKMRSSSVAKLSQISPRLQRRSKVVDGQAQRRSEIALNKCKILNVLLV